MRPLVPHLLVASAVAVLTVGLAIPSGGVWEHVTSPDLQALYATKFEAAAHVIWHEWRLPLWNPFEYCGWPFFGMAQPAVLYPPMALCFGLFRGFVAMQTFYLLHVAILAFGCSRYWQREGVGPPEAIVGMMVVLAGLANGLANQGVDHPSFVACVAWLPFALMACERIAASIDDRAIALLASLIAAQWFVGYPELVADGLILVALMTVMTPQPVRGIHRLVWACALGTALAAVQLVPLAEAVAHSTRVDQQMFWSGIRHQQAAQAATFRTQHWNWLLSGCALLALAAPSRRRVGWLLSWAWTLFALEVPLRWIYAMPPFSGVRLPFGWTHLAPVFVGGLVAAALHTLRQRHHAIAVAVGLFITVRSGQALMRGLEPGRMLPKRPHMEQAVEARRSVFADLRTAATQPGRWIAAEGSHVGAPVAARLPFLTGWEPAASPRWLMRLFQKIGWMSPELTAPEDVAAVLAQRPRLFAMLGVGYVVASARAADALRSLGFAPVAVVPPDEVLLYRAPFPRARIVHRIRFEPEPSVILNTLADPTHDPRTLAFVDVPLDLQSFTNDSPQVRGVERARIILDQAEQVHIKATLTAPGLLVLADTYFPGWEATVDGRSSMIVRTDQLFRGVPLRAGRHVITFDYRPASVRQGAAISGIAAALLALLLAVSRRTRPTANTDPSSAAP